MHREMTKESGFLMRTIPYPNCPLCGSSGEILFSGLEDRLFGAQGEWSISLCSNTLDCGLLWLNPRPLEEDIFKAYVTYYTHPTASGVKSLRSRLKSSVLDLVVYALALCSSMTTERRNVADLHLNELVPGRLLEIGCGDGSFLSRMKNLGWEVEGVDFDAMAAESAKEKFNVEVKVGRLEDMHYPEGAFDAVTLRHVIEHVFDPVKTMREVSRILKPGGTAVLLTPNTKSLGLQTFGVNWRGLEPPRHIHLFSPNTLASVARKSGLEVVRSYSTAANAWVVLLASMQLAEGNPELNGMLYRPSMKMVLKSLWMHYREALINRRLHNVGEECVLVARRSKPIS